MLRIPVATPHPLKAPLRKSGLTYWQICKIVGLKTESDLSRMLGGTKPMPKEVETGLRHILDELKQPVATTK